MEPIDVVATWLIGNHTPNAHSIVTAAEGYAALPPAQQEELRGIAERVRTARKFTTVETSTLEVLLFAWLICRARDQRTLPADPVALLRDHDFCGRCNMQFSLDEPLVVLLGIHTTSPELFRATWKRAGVLPQGESCTLSEREALLAAARMRKEMGWRWPEFMPAATQLDASHVQGFVNAMVALNRARVYESLSMSKLQEMLAAIAQGTDLFIPHQDRLLREGIGQPSGIYRGASKDLQLQIPTFLPPLYAINALWSAGDAQIKERIERMWYEDETSLGGASPFPWEFDKSGKKQLLYFEGSFALERNDDGKQKAAAVTGRELSESCPACDQKLVAILELDVTNPRLGFLRDALGLGKAIARVRVPACFPCISSAEYGEHTLFKLGLQKDHEPWPGSVSDGGPDPRPSNARSGQKTLALSKLPRLPTENNPDVSFVGGQPVWQQEPHFPPCPECSKRMHFIAQVVGHDMGESGTFYVFVCCKCRGAVTVQQFD